MITNGVEKLETDIGSNDIYLTDGNDDDFGYILDYATVRSYINAIAQNMNVMHLNIDKLANNVYPKLKTKNTIEDLQFQIITSASEMVTDHYDYPSIATWILINNLHKNTHSDYMKVVEEMKSNVNKKGNLAPIVSSEFYEYVKENINEINATINYDRDYDISIFGFRTLEKSYLKRFVSGQIIERPQHMYMRVAIGLHYRSNKIEKIKETYDYLSEGYFIQATPTLFNAGTNREQLSSCFLLGIDDDMELIGNCWKNCAVISKYAGGIAVHGTNIRVAGAYIHSTQGEASGMRLLSVFNQIARYADQGGKRAGSIAWYIEPWHGDIYFFLDLKKNTGAETERTRDLFLGLMVNDIFMTRVEEDGVWSLMCPSECPELLNKYGTEFTTVYEKYESEKKYLKQIKARDLFFKIMESQIESGVPYIIFKDAANYKSNQKNIGVINSSNLCVSPDTKILTSTGYHTISKLENRTVSIWNGTEFSTVTVRKTGVNQNLMLITFSNGSTLRCTAYHKFYLTENKVEAQELKIGDCLISVTYPIIDTTKSFNHPYTHGLFCTTTDNILYKDQLSLFAHVNAEKHYYSNNTNAMYITLPSDIPKKFKVPINYNLETKLKWLAGLLDSNVTIIDSVNRSVYIVSNIKFLNKVKYLLHTVSCNVSIYEDKLILTMADISKLKTIGLVTHGLQIDCGTSLITENVIMVTGVHTLEERADTFCFTEPKRNMGIFNGIIAGNCCEILEVSTESSYSVCNLASVCLPKFVDFKNGNPHFDYKKLYKIVRVVTRNLDNIIDINFYPVKETIDSNLNNRPIGIGVQGLADVFAMFHVAFDSEVAKELNKKIFETIYFAAMTESMTLAKEVGPYKSYPGSPISEGKFQFDLWAISSNELSGMWNWEILRKDILKYGVRNSLVTACMPTASTSQIMGNNECCCENTKIYTTCGLTKNIQDFSKNNKVLGWSNKQQLLENSNCYQKLDKGVKPTLKLIFEDGREIKCTPDHKFLSYDQQWIKAKDIDINTKIMAGIDGTYDKKDDDELNYKLIAGDMIFTMDTEEERYKTLAFSRILGYMWADRTTDQHIIDIHMATKYDAESVSEDILKLEGIKPDIYDNGRTFRINIDSKLTKAIISLKNIVGTIPDFVTDEKCPKSIVREFIAGYFGGIGHAPFFSGTILHGITLSHSIESMENINKLMVRVGMENSLISRQSDKDSEIILLSVSSGTQFLETIGFRYCIEKMLRLTAANVYWKSAEIQKDLSPVEFMESIGCLNWFSKKLIIGRNDKQLPYFGLKLIAKIDDTEEHVWDINVEHTHSFVANGIVVHNCFEPYTENIYTRNTSAGDYYVINKYLMKDLMELNLWDSDTIDLIKYYGGSVEQIPNIPSHIKELYKTVWEIPQQSIIDMAADRALFVDQTQSMNIFIDKPNFVKLTSCLFHAWKLGLKTGIYYLRSKPPIGAAQFGINMEQIEKLKLKYNLEDNDMDNSTSSEEDTGTDRMVCNLIPKHLRKPGEICLMCQ